MPKKKTLAEPGPASPGGLQALELAGLTITFPATVRHELLTLGESLGLGVRATQDLVGSFFADPEEGPARAAELRKHLAIPLTRFRHAQELAALKARQEEVERAQRALAEPDGEQP